MSDIIEVKGQYYIQANASIADLSTRVLKHADTFAVMDRHGNVRPLGFENHGIFHKGSRFVSRWNIRINGLSPLLLSSNVKEDNDFFTVDLTNPNLQLPDNQPLSHGTIHFVRTIFLWDGEFFERTEISNFALQPVSLAIEFEFQADYIDLFEIRGTKRNRRGRMLPPDVNGCEAVLQYDGLDSVRRRTQFHFTPSPEEMTAGHAVFHLHLKPQEQKVIDSRITFISNGESPKQDEFQDAFNQVHLAYEKYRKNITLVRSSNPQFNDWINQSRADLHLLLTHTKDGPFPYAGIPWFSCIFGRDGIITALETLWIYPEIARGVLGYLAKRQATETIPARDAEPGKILHERRLGEMANLGEVPFSRYYGSIDATPLFVALAGAYFDRTGDLATIRGIWPQLRRALDWIDRDGDSDGDGFVEYSCRATGGLSNQGWKDAEDSVFHSDGREPDPPIALCEVQGYVYAAKLRTAEIADALGHHDKAGRLRKAAGELRAKFHAAFWCKDIQCYAIALDGHKKPCCVRSSNAGQTLFTGIAQPEAALKIKNDMLSDAFFNGWGIRTIPCGAPRYNPMSYHNGSVWPHDNALIAAGMARYGFKDGVLRILNSLFETSQFVESNRLPELFCGFQRRRGEGPTLYPVACNPQAWSSAAIFFILQACLGIRIEAAGNRVYFDNPVLPEFISQLEIKNLKGATGTADVLVIRNDNDVAVNVRHRTGKIEVVVIH